MIQVIMICAGALVIGLAAVSVALLVTGGV